MNSFPCLCWRGQVSKTGCRQTAGVFLLLPSRSAKAPLLTPSQQFCVRLCLGSAAYVGALPFEPGSLAPPGLDQTGGGSNGQRVFGSIEVVSKLERATKSCRFCAFGDRATSAVCN